MADQNESTYVTTVTNHRTFNAFGRLVSESNSAVDSDPAYTGKITDSDTNLQNNLNRWYDAVLGQWTGEDPIEFLAGDSNLRRYVTNIPLQFVDPNGLQEIYYPEWPGEIYSSGNPPAQVTPGSRNDMPAVLPGTWRVYVVVEGEGLDLGHAFIVYEELDGNGNPTGRIHTAGKYPVGRGAWAGEPTTTAGAQWDFSADMMRWREHQASLVYLSMLMENPRPVESMGYTGYYDSCATYARDVWYEYSKDFIWLPGPDIPWTLGTGIINRQNPPPPPEVIYYPEWPGGFNY